MTVLFSAFLGSCSRTGCALSLTLFAFCLSCLTVSAFGFQSGAGGRREASSNGELVGIVLDTEGNAVANAYVRLSGVHFGQSTSTGRDGRFVFTHIPSGGAMLTVEAPGFSRYQQQWDNVHEMALPLRVQLALAARSEQVTVTATRTGTPLSDTAASVQIISHAEIQATSALTLDDVLRQTPGFTLFRRTSSRYANPTSQGVSLRGVGASGASRALVLADGIPLNDPFGGWVYWDRVPREALDRIEVVEGGASDLYGSDALGGVIDLITRHAEGPEFDVDSSYGNENTPDVSLWANLEHGRWGAQIGGEYFNTDGYVLVPPSLRGPMDVPAGSQHDTASLNLYGNVTPHSHLFFEGNIFGEQRGNGNPFETNGTNLRQLAGGWDWQSDTAGSVSVRAYGGPQVFAQDFYSVALNRASESLTDVQRVPAQDAGFSMQWTRQAGERQTLVAGVDGSQVQGSSIDWHYLKGLETSVTGAGGRQQIGGIYGEDILRLTPAWLLTADGRVDSWRNYDALSTTRPLASTGPLAVQNYADVTQNTFSPRVSLLHRLNSRVSAYASGYRAFRAPTLNELYRPFRLGNVVTLANSGLAAEQLTGAEAGASYSPFGNRFLLRGDFFWDQIANPVENVTLSATQLLITRQRQNLGRIGSRGIELDVEGQLTHNLILNGGYQYVDARVLSFPANQALVGLRVPEVPAQNLTMQVRYFLPGRFTAGIQARYMSSQYDDDLNQFLLGPAFVVDALVSHPLRRGAEIYAAAENLTGQRYAIAATPVTFVAPPVLVRAGFRMHFGAH